MSPISKCAFETELAGLSLSGGARLSIAVSNLDLASFVKEWLWRTASNFDFPSFDILTACSHCEAGSRYQTLGDFLGTSSLELTFNFAAEITSSLISKRGVGVFSSSEIVPHS